ncbi:MAG: serine/threonine protein kinase [Candidatus Obscuribacter sp.]|nr:serine/threonine protein kinase [Candidatus Obscuribacter sp.]MBK9276566.1 serine/threonine protein kinase [Candidatus Obscuribacter sp.]
MNDQSKSRLFTVLDGTLVCAEPIEPLPGLYLKPGTVIDGKFRVLSLLGEGGMGAVYRVRHLMLAKDVALKTFCRSALNDDTCLRFQREAQSLAKLNHSSIIAVYDFGLSQDGIPYYTMEFLAGCSLADRIKSDGPITAAEAVELFQPICRGLFLAHSKGIIHRDLKPGNIFLTTGGGSAEAVDVCAKIVDFGIASLTDAPSDGQRLTRCGAVFGSPLYMSPEQAAGLPVTARSDIYSLGCTIFEALTGCPPFRGESAMETIVMHDSAPVPTLEEASGGKSFPPELEQLVARMLAKAPQARPSDMKQVELALRKLSFSPGFVVDVPDRDEFSAPPLYFRFTPGRLCLLAAFALILVVLSTAIIAAGWGGKSSAKVAFGAKLADTTADYELGQNLVRAPGKSQVEGLQNCLSKAELADFNSCIADGNYDKGVQVLQRAKTSHNYQSDSLEAAVILANLGYCYSALNRHPEAERSLERSIQLFSKEFGYESRQVATSLMFLAASKARQRHYDEAEKFFKKALTIGEAKLGKDDPMVADCLNGLGQLYVLQRKLEPAELCYRRALFIYEHTEIPAGDIRREAMLQQRRWLNSRGR